jgi:antitoxin YefM
MYTTYHFNSASEITTDIIEAIKLSFKTKAIKITIEEELDDTAYLLSNEANKKLLLKSIEQDKNGEAIMVKLPK